MGTIRVASSDITVFLDSAKKLILAGRYVFIPRGKNLQALACHGMTIADAKSVITELTVGDYYKGPKRDFDPAQPGDIWEFKKDLGGETFYVKLKIQNRNGADVLKCLSFHEDDFKTDERR